MKDNPWLPLDILEHAETRDAPKESLHVNLAEHLLDGALDIAIVVDELESYLHYEEASSYLWLEPHLRGVMASVDAILQRLAN